MRWLALALVLAPQEFRWPAGKASMAGYWVRWAADEPWPELMKLSDRHTHWGHKTEPPGSFGKIVAMGLGENLQAMGERAGFSERRFFRKDGEERFSFTMSRLSPALWVESQAARLVAFQGARPRHLAWAGEKGPAYGSVVNGADLKESWILAWRGTDSPCSLSFVPSFLHAAPNPIDRADYEKHVKPRPADAPWLVVFQRRPSKVELAADGLAIEFPERTGRVAFLPLGGFRWNRGAETEAWAGNFPADVAARCSAWNRYLKEFPRHLKEEPRVEGDAVHVETRVTFDAIEDDWKTPGLRFAPLPPVTGLALLSGLGNLSASAKWVDLDYPTLTGAWGGFEGTDRYTVTFSGWRKYFEAPAPRPARKPDPRIRSKLEEHLKDMLEAGHLAPCESIQGTLQYSFWGNPGDLASTLLAARRHASPDLQKRIDAYLRDENAKYPILKYGWVPPREGARREGYPIDLDVKDIVGRRRKEEGARIENLYGLWERSAHFDDWGWLESQWDEVRRIVHARDDRLDWEIGFMKGGVHDLNLRIKGLAGYLQLARRRKDPEAEAEAARLVTQALVNRFAFAKLPGHLFASRQYHVPPEFDLPRFHARNAHKFNIFLPAYRKGADYRIAPQVGWVGAIDGTVLENRYLSEIGNFWHDHSVWTWADLTPPLAAFLAESAMPEQRNYMACIEEGLPTWWVTKAENLHAIGEDAWFSPYVSWPVFQAKALIFREPASTLARFVDLPYGRGDLYYLQNLAAVLDTE